MPFYYILFSRKLFFTEHDSRQTNEFTEKKKKWDIAVEGKTSSRINQVGDKKCKTNKKVGIEK